MQTDFKTIEDYIQSFSGPQQALLLQMKELIKAAAPDAIEAISYGMPTFKTKGNLVHFAAYKNHIGFYPTPTAIIAFKDRLSGFKQSKGAIQFPLDKPLPKDLIQDIIHFRLQESLAKETDDVILAGLSAPARRALKREKIDTPKILAQYTEQQILNLHGVGKTSIPRLKEVLAKQGLTFKT